MFSLTATVRCPGRFLVHFSFVLTLWMASSASHAQVQSVTVSKSYHYIQSSATAVTLDPASNNYGFGADVNGVNIGGITAPTVTGPFNTAALGSAHNNGTLLYSTGDKGWRYGFPNANDAGRPSLSSLNSDFGSGTYTFIVNGISIPMQLTGDAYPNAPMLTFSGGAWVNGKYEIDPSKTLTITSNAFTAYGSHADDLVGVGIALGSFGPLPFAQVAPFGCAWLPLSACQFHSTVPGTNFATLTIPPNTLVNGQEYLSAANFTAMVDVVPKAGLPGSINTAYYSVNTTASIKAVSAAATAPVCELLVSPSAITAGRSATLTASCIPTATAFSWTGGTCPGTIGPTCIVTPTATNTYSVTGSNAGGAGKPAGGTVTIVAPIFPLTVNNTSTPTVANVSAALQFRPQDVPAVNNIYVFALAPAALVKNVPVTALSNPKGPVVSSTKAADGPAACVLAQLLNGELKFASTSTLQPFLTGVLGSLGASVNVLNGVSTVLIGGAVFYVGYGTDPNTMVVNGTNQTVATIPGPITCLPQTPQTGWWWFPAQDGRGFGIEVQGNNMFMSGYLYDSTGHATWMVAEGKVSVDGSVFSNKLYQVANGQTLTGTYKAPGSITFPGDITLSFTNARSGTLIWPGGIIPIQRFDDVIGQGNGTTPAFVPETGWWWNQTESGRGYFIEIKNNYAFIAGYMYEADGRPVWYIAEGAMSAPQFFNSRFYEAANGQTLTGQYKKPNIQNGNVGSVSIQFLTTTTATLTLPDGRLLSITRQRY